MTSATRKRRRARTIVGPRTRIREVLLEQVGRPVVRQGGRVLWLRAGSPSGRLEGAGWTRQARALTDEEGSSGYDLPGHPLALSAPAAAQWVAAHLPEGASQEGVVRSLLQRARERTGRRFVEPQTLSEVAPPHCSGPLLEALARLGERREGTQREWREANAWVIGASEEGARFHAETLTAAVLHFLEPVVGPDPSDRPRCVILEDVLAPMGEQNRDLLRDRLSILGARPNGSLGVATRSASWARERLGQALWTRTTLWASGPTVWPRPWAPGAPPSPAPDEAYWRLSGDRTEWSLVRSAPETGAGGE